MPEAQDWPFPVAIAYGSGRLNAPAIVDRIQPMAEAMGLADRSFDGFYGAVCRLLDDLEIPRTLTEIGVPAGCAAALAEKARRDSAASTNLRPSSIMEIAAVIEDAMTGGR